MKYRVRVTFICGRSFAGASGAALPIVNVVDGTRSMFIPSTFRKFGNRARSSIGDISSGAGATAACGERRTVIAFVTRVVTGR